MTPATGTLLAGPSPEEGLKHVASLKTASVRSCSASPPPGSEYDILKAAESRPAPAADATAQLTEGEWGLVWSDGATYKGDLDKGSLTSRGVMHGYGTWRSGDGEVTYTGQWSDDQWHGQGELVCEFGTYDGEFVNGLFDGHGVMHWNDSRYYEGMWKHGKRHGYGLNLSKHGQQRVGYWEQNRYVGLEEPGCCS